MTTPGLDPFADAVSLTIGGLTIENGPAAVAVYGSLDITRDQAGLARARALQAVLVSVMAALERDPALPTEAPASKPRGVKPNPFR